MASASDIAVQSSNYTGNAQLGGANVTELKLDLTPLSQLVAYTNLYNKAQYDQRQKNADELIQKYTAFSDIDLSALPVELRTKLEEEYSELRKKGQQMLEGDIPTNPDEKVKWMVKWQDANKDFNDKYKSAARKSISLQSQITKIRENPDYNLPQQEELIKELKEKIKNDNILDPLDAFPKFKPTVIEGVEPKTFVFQKFETSPNTNFVYQTKNTVFDANTTSNLIDAQILLDKKGTPQFLSDGSVNPEWEKLDENSKIQQKLNSFNLSRDKPALAEQMANEVNKLIAPYLDENGMLSEENKKKVLAADKLGVIKMLYKLSDGQQKNKTQLLSGDFNSNKDGKIEKTLPDDFFDKGIITDWRNITPQQIMLADAYLKAPANTKEVTQTKTDYKLKGIERALTRENMYLQFSRKTSPTTSGGRTTPAPLPNGGVNYWTTRLLPQIQELDLLKGVGKVGRFDSYGKKPQNFSGDIPITLDKVAGLGITLFGEKEQIEGGTVGTYNVVPKVFTPNTQIKVRYNKGVPSGVVVDGRFYDQNEIDSKAVDYNNNSVKNKQDTPPLGTSVDEFGIPN